MTVDMVNHPPHYNQSSVECIDAIEAATGSNFKFYLQGNVMKYLWRFDYKGEPIKDLKKAQWYLERLIKEVTLEEYEKYGDTSSDSVC
tara:strand:- start:2070 stop:2333 length:264 start_codon:yes stop_codon:yes gene_type:complete